MVCLLRCLVQALGALIRRRTWIGEVAFEFQFGRLALVFASGEGDFGRLTLEEKNVKRGRTLQVASGTGR